MLKTLVAVSLLICVAGSNSTAAWCGKSFGKCYCGGTVTFDQSCDVVRAEVRDQTLDIVFGAHGAQREKQLTLMPSP